MAPRRMLGFLVGLLLTMTLVSALLPRPAVRETDSAAEAAPPAEETGERVSLALPNAKGRVTASVGDIVTLTVVNEAPDSVEAGPFGVKAVDATTPATFELSAERAADVRVTRLSDGRLLGRLVITP